ncbi:hypothetical protein Q7P37_007474 [Cladosporium fusiforme]
MSLPWHSSHRAGRSLRLLRAPCRRNYADARPFAVGDHVMLRPSWDRTATPVLRGPLKPGKRIDTHKGIVHHDDIIGKRVREFVRTATLKSGKDGAVFRLQGVTLDEYVRLSRRLVTPIYPADANLIVSLLDLHPDVYDAEDTGREKLEILEAGTGHGGLTLHLSRAIHAANPPRPKISEEEDTEKAYAEVEAWKARRQAVLHTIDVASQYSAHAKQTIAAFRKGQYLHNIDFNVGSVSDWVSSALSARDSEPFLSHAFLDLPNADMHVTTVAEALKVDGTLIVFNPSITQINECALKIKQEGIPLDLDRVIELGVNGGSGGREWDVRPVKPRATKPQASLEPAAEENDAEPRDEEESRDEEQQQAQVAPAPESEAEGKWHVVCRPKVGDRVVGGGFLGVFRKQRPRSAI